MWPLDLFTELLSPAQSGVGRGLGGLLLLPRPTSWRFVSSSGGEIGGGPSPITFGAGFVTFYVKKDGDNTIHQLFMYYGEIGFGVSPPIPPVTLSVPIPSWPSAGSRIYRGGTKADSSLSDFAGPCAILTANAGAYAGGAVSMVLFTRQRLDTLFAGIAPLAPAYIAYMTKAFGFIAGMTVCLPSLAGTVAVGNVRVDTGSPLPPGLRG